MGRQLYSFLNFIVIGWQVMGEGFKISREGKDRFDTFTNMQKQAELTLSIQKIIFTK
jgi:hypothetical protein